MSEKAKSPRRPYLQFGLPTLLLLVLALSGLLAWRINKAKQQQASVAWVRQVGGSVLYEYEVGANGTVSDNCRPPAPPWLTDPFGIDIFDEVVSVNLTNGAVRDLAPLQRLKRIQWLRLAYTEVSDLSPWASNSGMSSLNLTGSQVSEISVLAGMQKLKKLDIRATAIADLSPLAGMTELRHLDIFDTPITDLSPLAETTALSVELGGTALQGLLPLVGMRDANIWLYKYPHETVPGALESRRQQVQIRPIYKRHGE